MPFKCHKIFIFIVLCLIFFRFLRLFIYVTNIGQVLVQVLFITYEQLRTFFSTALNIKCWGSTAAVLICKYLFTFVKVKDSESVLKSCLEKAFFSQDFLSSFILTIRVQYGKIFNLACVVNIKLGFTK